MKSPHVPVLLDEVLRAFSDTKGWIVDCTLGYGGHSEALLRSTPQIEIFGIDQDQEAIEFSKKRLASYGDRVRIEKGRYSQKIVEALERLPVKGVLADIGVSSLQLDKKERGFGLQSETLDMRMDQNASLSAYDVVNSYDEERLAKIFKEYGEIPQARRLAKAVVEHRPIQSAKELAAIAQKVLPQKGHIHPATTMFQAIRIEVNQELEELTKLLDALERYRPSGAKVAIITFHSLEDRIVKNRFKEWAKKCICPPEAMKCECGGDNALGQILTKKPITATKEEIAQNPRARSAKMRLFQFKERK